MSNSKRAKKINDSKMITASEINRFIYCNYQWYYERLYGKAYIRERYKKRNESYKRNDPIKSNFVNGRKFHENYVLTYESSRLPLIFLIVLFLLSIFGILYFSYRFW